MSHPTEHPSREASFALMSNNDRGEATVSLLAVILTMAAVITAVSRGVYALMLAVAGDSIAAYASTTVAVLGFAGLLVRQIVQSNGAWKEIVTSLREDILRKDRELAVKDTLVAFVTHEREQARFRAGERPDPGPNPYITAPPGAPVPS